MQMHTNVPKPRSGRATGHMDCGLNSISTCTYSIRHVQQIDQCLIEL